MMHFYNNKENKKIRCLKSKTTSDKSLLIERRNLRSTDLVKDYLRRNKKRFLQDLETNTSNLKVLMRKNVADNKFFSEESKSSEDKNWQKLRK